MGITRDEWVALPNDAKFADLAELLEGPLGELYASREEPTPEGPAEEPAPASTRKGGAKSG